VTYPLENRYRVAISCSHVPDTLKMRGVAAFRLQPDQHTEWFTETGRTFYSQWTTPLLGLTPEAKAKPRTGDSAAHRNSSREASTDSAEIHSLAGPCSAGAGDLPRSLI